MFHWFTDAIASTTTTITFFTIFLVGVVFSAFSLVLGGLAGHADHDAGHGIDHDAGGHDASGHGADDGGTLAVGMFSVRGIALLATGFGGVGFLVHISTGRMLISTASALAG